MGNGKDLTTAKKTGHKYLGKSKMLCELGSKKISETTSPYKNTFSKAK